MNRQEYNEKLYSSELYHHGIKGQKWGVRRFQNEDGSLTPAGKKRYLNSDGSLTDKGKKKLDRDKYDENTKSEAIKNGVKARLNIKQDIATPEDAAKIYDDTTKLADQGFVKRLTGDGSYDGHMQRTNDDGSVDDVFVGHISYEDNKMRANKTKDLPSVAAEKEKVIKSKEYKQVLEDFISDLKSYDDYESDKEYYQEIEREARKAAAHPDMRIDMSGLMTFSLDNQFYMYRDPQTKKLEVMYFD